MKHSSKKELIELTKLAFDLNDSGTHLFIHWNPQVNGVSWELYLYGWTDSNFPDYKGTWYTDAIYTGGMSGKETIEYIKNLVEEK